MYGADGRSALSTGTCFAKKVEWLDETLLTPRSTIAATSTTGDTFIVLATGDQIKFSTGDVLLIGSEYMRVTGYGSTADTLTVTRAYSGSAATVATSAAVVGVGRALPEGSDPENARFQDRSNRYNLTQIFGPEAVLVSGSEQAVRKYGIEGTTEFEKQVANRMKELAVAIEQTLIYGVRAEDLTNKWRTMAGIDAHITTNVDSSTTTLTESVLLDKMQTLYDAGGAPDRFLSGSKQARVVSSFATGIQIQVGRTDNGRGQVVEFFDSDFGRVSKIMDRWVRVNNLYLFEREQASVETLRPLAFVMLAKTGDSTKGMVVGEKTMRFRRQSHALKMTALT
jgi:hypothetical protein